MDLGYTLCILKKDRHSSQRFTFGFAFLRNNVMALLTALIFLIQILIEVRFEDSEIIERVGEEHKEYIKNTGALFPHKNVGTFLKLLFFLKR